MINKPIVDYADAAAEMHVRKSKPLNESSNAEIAKVRIYKKKMFLLRFYNFLTITSIIALNLLLLEKCIGFKFKNLRKFNLFIFEKKL